MKYIFNLLKSKQGMISRLSGIIIVFALWDFATRFNLVSSVLLSSPKEVLSQLIWFLKSGFIYEHLLISMEEFVIGFILALIMGIFLGFVFGLNDRINNFTKLLTYSLYATPIIAIFPLIIIWFGIEFWSKVIIIFLLTLFPILISVTDAVRNTDLNYLKLAKSFHTSKINIIKSIIFPSSVPNIISGIRIAVPRAIVGMVVAEFFIGEKGIGYLIAYYGATFYTARLLAAVLILVILSISMNLLIDYIERKSKLWRIS